MRYIIRKGLVHKYYKREGVKGAYKYYYTKDEYDKEHKQKEQPANAIIPETESDIRSKLKLVDDKLDKLGDEILSKHEGLSFMQRVKVKNENKEYRDLFAISQDLRSKLVDLVEKNKKEKQEATPEKKEDDSYMMRHRPNEDGATADNISIGDIAMPESFYKKPQDFMNMNDVGMKESFNILLKIKNKPNASITIYRATTGNEINNGDWISLSKDYAKEHNRNSLDNKGNIVKIQVKAKDIRFAGDDIREFGYFPNNNMKKSMKYIIHKSAHQDRLLAARQEQADEPVMPFSLEKFIETHNVDVNKIGKLDNPSDPENIIIANMKQEYDNNKKQGMNHFEALKLAFKESGMTKELFNKCKDKIKWKN